MRILHLDSGRQMRGGQWQALYLMVGQKTMGLHPVLLARRGSPLMKEAEQRGIPCSSLNLLSVARESRKYDITHAHDARTHTYAALVGRPPFVVSRRVGFPVKMGWPSRWKYEKPARYLAISEFVAAQLTAAGVSRDRIAVVYDGVPVEPDDIPLGDRLVAPDWGDDLRKGTALAMEAAMLAHVSLHTASDLGEALKTARALLYLTEVEGLGSAALLAMSAGVPVIASRAGGLPEIVHDGMNGLLVENDPQQVATAIRRLMSDRDLAARMGRKGRDFVRGGFTLADMALRTLYEYKRVLA
jgi:hypothetical protein